MQAASQRAKRSFVDHFSPLRMDGDIPGHRPRSVASRSDDVNSETPAPTACALRTRLVVGPCDDPRKTPAASERGHWRQDVHGAAGVRGAQMVKDYAAPGDVEETIVMTNIVQV
jgi:hypothetical protein